MLSYTHFKRLTEESVPLYYLLFKNPDPHHFIAWDQQFKLSRVQNVSSTHFEIYNTRKCQDNNVSKNTHAPGNISFTLCSVCHSTLYYTSKYTMGPYTPGCQ